MSKNINEINEAIADAVADEHGYASIKDAQADLKEKINTNPKKVRRANPELSEAQAQARARNISERAKGDAFKLVSRLLVKVLRQEIEETPLPSFLDVVNQFQEAEYLNKGNTKEYIYDTITGVTSFDRTVKITSSIQKPSIVSSTISMFNIDSNGNKTLTNQSFQLKNQITLPYDEWIPFFVEGKLNEFLNKQREKLRKQWAIYKYDQIMGMLSTTAQSMIYQATTNDIVGSKHVDGGYVLSGTTPDLFQAIVKDVYPVLTQISISDGNYQAGGESFEGVITITNPNDVIIMMNPNTEAALRAGISSQLFNAKVFDLKSWISENNILVVGKKYNIPGANQWTFNNNVIGKAITNANIQAGQTQEEANLSTQISKSEDNYLPDNTMIIFNKNMIRLLLQINTPQNQFYANNLMEDLFLHVWGCYGILPWFPMIVYYNPNLNVLPSDEINTTTGA